jgi:EAL domain-containing protein (putative c-di-GMP-specific phosphodiesterase class I)
MSLAHNLLSAGKYFYASDDGIILNSTITIGVATGVGALLLQHADIALRQALGKLGSIVRYDSSSTTYDETQALTHQTLKLISDAIENGGITPYYQPIKNLSSGEIYGYECLVRIVNEGIVYSPATFLDTAFNANQISAITRLMIRKSFEFFALEENRKYRFSINLSDEDLKDETMIEYIKYWLEKFSLDPSRVSFEILENVNLYICPSVQQRIEEIKSIGCCISVDDFGTGYSNFLQLVALKPHFIKIDGSFVQRLIEEPEFSAIFSKIVQLIHLCGSQCVAEYVSTKELEETLRKLDVDFVQGYAIGKPESSLL